MTTATFEPDTDSILTTDSDRSGCEARGMGDLTAELTTALNGAFLSFLLRAELEEAFDTALLRAAIAETPTMSSATWV